MSGGTYQTTAGAWATGEYYATSNQVNACDSTSNDFRITGVQLEPGTSATPFEFRPFQQELSLCQRYYEKSYAMDQAPAATILPGIQYVESGTVGITNGSPLCTVKYAVAKRSNGATITIRPYTTHTNTGRVSDSNTGADAAAGSGNALNQTQFSFNVSNASGGTITGSNSGFMFHWEAENEL
jgi:hypothetical protein